MPEKQITKNVKAATALLSIGTLLEYFDLMLFVHMAIVLNDLFFPKTDPFNATLLSTCAFCSTYILRPLSALVFGWIGDHFGRKATVIITTFAMAVSCLIMANLPTYAQIGTWAAVIMISCRIVQGITSMGERVSAEIYLTEETAPPYQYPIVALIAGFATLGGTVALGFATALMKYDFNWRYAFWVGGAVALVGMSARRRLLETREFLNYKKLLKQKLEKETVEPQLQQEYMNLPMFQKASTKKQLAFFFIQCAHPICFYFIFGYCVEVLKTKFHCSSAEIIHGNFIVSLFELAKMMVIMPILSYFFNPLKILKIKFFIFIAGILVCPYFLSIAESAHDVFLIQLVFAMIAIGSGPALPIFYSHFPIGSRSTNASVIYAVARMIMYVATSFAIVLLVEYFGYFGMLLMMLPIFLGYFLGLRYFEKLESQKEVGTA